MFARTILMASRVLASGPNQCCQKGVLQFDVRDPALPGRGRFQDTGQRGKNDCGKGNIVHLRLRFASMEQATLYQITEWQGLWPLHSKVTGS